MPAPPYSTRSSWKTDNNICLLAWLVVLKSDAAPRCLDTPRKSGTPRSMRDLTGHHSEILIQLRNEMVVSGMGQNRIQSPTTEDNVQ